VFLCCQAKVMYSYILFIQNPLLRNSKLNVFIAITTKVKHAEISIKSKEKYIYAYETGKQVYLSPRHREPFSFPK
jgi:hypothetical protein